MTPSPAGVALIQRFEQCRLTAYMPTPNDKPTIGWGATGADIKMGMTWTQAECDQRFADDLGKFAQGVSAALPGETSQNQFDAMTSLAYNIGIGAFEASTLLRLHNAGDFTGAEAQFAVWNKQAGKVLNGLTRRRAAEAAMYRGD
jgi:GH24 family phage-related lysozyme (muramidase)